MSCETNRNSLNLSKLCSECLTLFRIKLPGQSYSLYVWGKCEGCLRNTHVTNPDYFIREVKKTDQCA